MKLHFMYFDILQNILKFFKVQDANVPILYIHEPAIHAYGGKKMVKLEKHKL